MRKIKSRSGFSLIETLLSALLFTFVVMAIGSSIIVSVRLNAKARRMTEARLAVSSAVETIMADGYDEDADYDAAFTTVEVVLTNMPATDHYAEITVTSKTEPNVSVETVVGIAPETSEGGEG